MYLTLPMFLKNPKGHLFRGKYRLVKRVSQRAIDTLRYQFQQEERNMFYLRHPYLNKEESSCLKEIVPTPNLGETYWNQNNAKFEKRRTIEEELKFLNVSQNWDFKGGFKL